MLLCVDNVLSPDERAGVDRLLARAQFDDGLGTVWAGAAEVKRNRQLSPEVGEAREAAEIVARALQRNEMFLRATRPRSMTQPRFVRYEPGMHYGSHWDDAVARSPLMRYDVSFTLFLCDPDEYDGGELIVESPQGEQAFKLPAGSLVLYPSTSLHRVTEVTRGIRLAAIGWVHSLVRDPARRELLYDLDTARSALYQREGKTREWDLLGKTAANLLRMWAEL